MNIPVRSMSSLSIITLASVLIAFPLVGGDLQVTERDILLYLQHVGHHARLAPDKDPVFYATEIPHEWNLNDKRVQQLVGPICGRLVPGSDHYEDMLYTCSIFEMLAAYLLHNVWQAVINSMKNIPDEKKGIWKRTTSSAGKRIRDLSQFDTRYNEYLPKLRMAHTREMLPSVCAKLEKGTDIMKIGPFKHSLSLAKDGCEFMKEIAVGFLKGIAERNGYQRLKIELENQVHSRVSFDDVKTMLPIVCEKNDDVQGPSWCGTFFRSASIVLAGGKPELPLPDLKPFLFHICNKKGIKDNEELNKRCNDLLTNSLEKFVSKK